MADMIRIQPTPGRRVAFARWAVAQRPKVRTVSPQAFAVPPRLFAAMPERLLIGSLVDGHRYISPEEDRQKTRARTPIAGAKEREVAIPLQRPKRARQVAEDSGLTELLGVATPEGLAAPDTVEREAVPGEPLPEVPSSAYGPDSVPLDEAPASDEDQADEDDENQHGTAGAYGCGSCDREFTTERGRDMHRRRVHREA